MPETLLSESNILLYGRVLTDLTVRRAGAGETEEEIHRPTVDPRPSVNPFLTPQLENLDSQLARIYGFSYQGHYYDLAKPVIFLVQGDGVDPQLPRPAEDRVSRAPAEADRTGVAATSATFSEDMQMWSYDKSDFSIRLDVESGPFEQILLEASSNPRGSYSGAEARISGAEARISGAEARISGAEARVSGAEARIRNR